MAMLIKGFKLRITSVLRKLNSRGPRTVPIKIYGTPLTMNPDKRGFFKTVLLPRNRTPIKVVVSIIKRPKKGVII
jgi:hypothetical protein